jgi:acetoacetyl-CoA synthetase
MWTPSAARVEASNLTRFMAQVKADWGVDCADDMDYEALHRWSVSELERFWSSVWRFCGVIGDLNETPVLVDGEKMPGARFFPEAQLNFAENLLRQRGPGDAMVFWGEDQVKRRVSHDELFDGVARLAAALKALGVGPGDRVAGFMPNLPETVMATLATASLGAIWSSCSPDFGVQGVLDRFGQIEPKVLFCPDGYFYGGKRHDSLARVAEFAGELPSLLKIVVVPYTEERPDVSALDKAELLPDVLATHPAHDIAFEPMAFNAPLFIMYSSGTTGKPKCIVHGAGGTLLKHLEEHQLQCDVKPGDRLFYFTTCGWMMWNWLISGLASEAACCSTTARPSRPTATSCSTSWRPSAAPCSAPRPSTSTPWATPASTPRRSTTWPRSAPSPRPALRSCPRASTTSTTTSRATSASPPSPAAPTSSAASSAATPTGRSGAARSRRAASAWRSRPMTTSETRCVARRASWSARSPSPPCRSASGTTPATPAIAPPISRPTRTERGGMIIYGRSDATLNPGGVRIGTAEIYRQVEQLEEIEEGIVVGQDWQGDVRVVLFVKLAAGHELDEALAGRIKTRIREGCTPRHVPAKVLAVADIPRTKSGKIVELAVRDVIHGRAVKNKEALANPEALELYAGRAELES